MTLVTPINVRGQFWIDLSMSTHPCHSSQSVYIWSFCMICYLPNYPFSIAYLSMSHLFQFTKSEIRDHEICLWYILKITLKYIYISREHVWSGGLEVGDHLVGVLVDLGELGTELLVLEGVAFLVEDLCQGGDEEQPLLGVDPGEVDGLAGGQLHGGALGFLASQVPEIDTIFFLI